MLAGTENNKNAVKSLISSFWITISFCALPVHGQEGNGCGHTKLGTESGTLASPNYPGTYPMDTWCTWRLRVPQGRMVRLLFGDFDIESSQGCSNGSLVITANNGDPRLGPLCGTLVASGKNVTVNGSEVTLVFRSGQHRSGRGFLLSYTTDLFPGLISCKHRGSHFNSQYFNVYCPAGCEDVVGDVWGNSKQGYRDTSVLCKAAVHAGVVSDNLGGLVTVTRGRSLTLYESTFANGILSKMGSLSESKLLFRQECNDNLAVSLVNVSSFWGKTDSQGNSMYWSPGSKHTAGQFQTWAADTNDQNPWVQLELSDKSTVKGIITTGSTEFYIESYTLLFSKDGKNWKPYKGALSKEKKVFESYSDGHVKVLNSLFPPVVARFVQLQPLSWHSRASVHIQLLGCPVTKVTTRIHSVEDSSSVRVNISSTQSSSVPTGDTVLVKDTGPRQPVNVAVGLVLGLIMCVSCLLAGVWWKRRKRDKQMKKYSIAKVGCQSFPGKSLASTQSELISYPMERNVHDTLPNPPLNDYAETALTAGGQKIGSTFRPSLEEGYTTPFSFTHYDTPGNLPEYATPLPPEPEYATPFSEQTPECRDRPRAPGSGHDKKAVTLLTAPCSGQHGSSFSHAHYDCPSHRVLSNGYCTPSLHAQGPQTTSVIYAEPQSCYSLLQDHTYEEPTL